MDKEYISFFDSQSELPYYKQINSFLLKEALNNKNIYPNIIKRFQAFENTPFKEMKVVIFGQDPYYSKDVADGMAFSTLSPKTPPSLLNIFKELKKEYPSISINTNNLLSWAKQGVLLLNTSLSVEEGKPNSHSKIGWEIFIKNFIQYLNQNKTFLIFILWGKESQKLKNFISSKFYILESSHPSPFSAYINFFGNNHFKKINEIILKNKLKPINWNL